MEDTKLSDLRKITLGKLYSTVSGISTCEYVRSEEVSLIDKLSNLLFIIERIEKTK